MTLADTHRRQFEILREIASGGFGSVFLCRVTQPDGFSRVVAVKLLHPQWSENEEVASRMRDEARLLGLLSHRNIVDVFDLTRLDGRVAVVMEYLEAVDLKSIIKTGARVPITAALQLGTQVASALDAAFNKAPVEGDRPLCVVHRDIKPSNIMVNAEGTAKVLDFGVARGEFDAREAETKGMAFGSFDYMPSERRFMESGGETSDVYSLAAVLYELLAEGEKLGKGKLKPDTHAVFVQERVQALGHQLSARGGAGGPLNPRTIEEVTAFLGRMLAFEAEQRPRPSQVVTVLRRLARATRGVGLEEWAEEHVPPLLATVRSRHDRRAQDPLVGQILVEERDENAPTPPPVPPRATSASQPPPPSDPEPQPEPAFSSPRPTTSWEADIPKRVRDAFPARPPITGTQTPAPLRRTNRQTPPRPPNAMPSHALTPPGAVLARNNASATHPPGGASNSIFSNVLYVGIWVFGLFVLVVGAASLLVVAWFAGQG